MHRIAATPGGWDSQTEGVVFIEQTPAPIVLITAADTDIQTLAQAVTQLPTDFPAIRVASLLNLQQQLTIDTYAENVTWAQKSFDWAIWTAFSLVRK
jgi:cobaltochelatase CobN